MVPAGGKGRFSLEDVVCGGMMVDLLGKEGEMARSCEHGRELIRLGLKEDLAFCVQTNVSSSVPVFKKGSITLD
jgi:phosphosulfolactate phosphohydrolase-like enzyme